MENLVEHVKGENYETFFSPQEGIAYLIYRGQITKTATTAVYNWMSDSIRRIAPQQGIVHGCLFDFTAVTGYELENLATARAKSVSFRLEQIDLISSIPTAMVIQTIEQRVLVETMMQLNQQGQNPRLKIVKTIDEAKKHFETFHANQAATKG